MHLEAPGSNTFEMPGCSGDRRCRATRQGAVVTMWTIPGRRRFISGRSISAWISPIQASTKYPAGHADILLGTVSANAEHWRRLRQTNGALGICGAADDAYQVLRGLRTMGVRLERHQASAVEIAEWLEGREEVARVLSPALSSFPGHEIWKRDFKGASGVFSFVLSVSNPQDFKRKAQAFLDALSLFGAWIFMGWFCQPGAAG